MIRLPATHAAITAPLVAASSSFPGIPIGRSATDGRPFCLSPVLVDASILPATNSFALGGLGSGKSSTAKVRARREILLRDHQYVVIDSFGEETAGEWGKLTESLGGLVVEAGEFSLSPCSPEFGRDVREQLIRSLIAAVEPEALTPQSTHALQHALNSPKADHLGGLVDALVDPSEDGRWPAGKLAEWGEGAAIALSRYTDGSLRGLFDGPHASLPPTDLPIISFDFSKLDRQSPAIPALMAAIACWVEHVWLRQSTAVHRHLVLEEAWQILLSPATSELIQRLLKNSRKAALSLDVVMHTLSDLGEGKAQDLARLCEIAHVGRLGPEEAAAVGALLGLPTWAIARIPTLEPGQAVWKVGPDFVDVVQTTLTDEEIELTDTSTRRRRAQEEAQRALSPDEPAVVLTKEETEEPDEGAAVAASVAVAAEDTTEAGAETGTAHHGPRLDARHRAVLQAAHEGRFDEAAQLGAIGEREDIAAHGIASVQAAAWLMTHAEVADLAGNAGRAAHLRATVARMGNDKGAAWFETDDAQWYQAPAPAGAAPVEPSPPSPPPADGPQPPPRRRRIWPYLAAAAVLGIGVVGWQKTAGDGSEGAKQAVPAASAAYKGRSGASLSIDSVDVDVVAQWSRDGDGVVVELRPYGDPDARYLRLDGGGETAYSKGEAGWYAKSVSIKIPTKDPRAEVTVRVAIGGKSWREGRRSPAREIRFSPTGVAYDAETGKALPSDL